MSTETTVLLLVLGLAFLHLGIPAVIRVMHVGLFPLAGSRDGVPYPDSVYYQRSDRANNNFKETLPWALALLILVQVLGVTNETSACGAWLYLSARAAYLPLYIFGVPWFRSLVWFVALAGIVMIGWPLFSA